MRCIAIVVLSWALLGGAQAQTGASTQNAGPTCGPLIEAVKKAGEQASKSINDAKTRADQSTKDDKDAVNACATGYITMEHNHFALDVPEFKIADQDIILDLPQVTMKQQHIIFGTPSVRCHDAKTGQYPETTCTDTWVTVGPIKT